MKHSVCVPGRGLPGRKIPFLLVGSVLDCTGLKGLSESPGQSCHQLERELPLNDPQAVSVQWGMERTARAIRGQLALWLEGQLVLRGEKMD